MVSLVRPDARDLAIAGTVCLAIALEGVVAGQRATEILVGAAPALSLSYRRAAPLVVPLAVLLAMAVALRLGTPGSFDGIAQVLVWILGAYAAGAYPRPVPALVGWGGWLLAGGAFVLWFGEDAADLVFEVLLVSSPWVAGIVVRRQRDRTATERRRAEEAAARADSAVRDERARIARELHDVVAHAVGIMVVQAGAAERVMRKDPAAARRALATVQDTGRGAIGELGRMLELLRWSDEGAHAPMPTLTRLGELAEETRAAGGSVQVTVTGALEDLPPALDLSAYRIVQEALTNVLKHAPGARTRVDVTRTDDELELSVVDDGGRNRDGRAVGSVSELGTGNGLAGVRERVVVFGGLSEIGPAPGGGFRVRAVLPLGGPTAGERS